MTTIRFWHGHEEVAVTAEPAPSSVNLSFRVWVGGQCLNYAGLYHIRTQTITLLKPGVGVELELAIEDHLRKHFD
jgi:hypothetical protein